MLLLLMSDAIALFFMWLLISAAIQKLLPENTAYFTTVIKNYGWKSESTAPLVGKLLGSFELIIGLAIMLPFSRTLATFLAMGLLLAYLIIMAYQLYQGHRDVDCGCAGPGGKMKMSELLLLRNIILIGLASFCLNTGSTFELNPWALSAAFALLAIMIYQSSEQLIANAQKLKTLRV